MPDKVNAGAEEYTLCRCGIGKPTCKNFPTYEEAYNTMLSEYCAKMEILESDITKCDIPGEIGEYHAFDAVLDIDWLICKPCEVDMLLFG